ncbi:coiled-coil domain-containing protein, partial [Cetobacterium sp.]
LSEKDRFVYTEDLKNIKLELLKAESFKTDGNSENEIAPPLPPRDENILADVDNKERENIEDDFYTNDDIWANHIEDKIEVLLEAQKKLSNKDSLTKNDKKKLNEIEKSLKKLLSETNENLNINLDEKNLTVKNILTSESNVEKLDSMEKKIESYKKGIETLKLEIQKLEAKKFSQILNRNELKTLKQQLKENEKSLANVEFALEQNNIKADIKEQKLIISGVTTDETDVDYNTLEGLLDKPISRAPIEKKEILKTEKTSDSSDSEDISLNETNSASENNSSSSSNSEINTKPLTTDDLKFIQDIMDKTDSILLEQKEIYQGYQNEKIQQKQINNVEILKSLEKDMDEIKNEITKKITNNETENIILSDGEKDAIEYIRDSFTVFEKNKELLFPEFYPTPTPQKTKPFTAANGNETDIIRRSEADIRKNIETIAKYASTIPPEHLINYLKNTIKNREFKELLKQIIENKTDNKSIILENPALNKDINTEKNLNKIYETIYSAIDTSIRKDLDDSLRQNLTQNTELTKLLNSEKVDSDTLKDIALLIQDIKADIYKKKFNEEYEKVNIKVELNKDNQNILGSNDGKNLYIYIKPNKTMLDYLTTIIHELAHQDQNNIAKTSNQDLTLLKHLYDLNNASSGYIKRDEFEYLKQPIEKEAYISENIANDIVKKEIEKGNESLAQKNIDVIIKEPKKEQVNEIELPPIDYELPPIDYELPPIDYLDNSTNPHYRFDYNHKILNNQKFDSTGIKIEHQPNKSTKNLEDPYAVNAPSFGDVSLIYGASGNDTSTNRDSLIFSIETNGNAPLIGDSYLDSLNTRHISSSNDTYMTPELKQIVSAITKDKNIDNQILEAVSQFKSSNTITEGLLHIDKVNIDSNKELLAELLKKDEVIDALKNIETLNNALLSDNLSDEDFNILYDKITDNYKIFFINKTITLADKVLNSGGKIYFSLDGIGTSTDINGMTYLDKDKLKDILFNKDSKFYNSITSQEFRFLYKNHLSNNGLKFLVNKQVIVFPKFS